MKKIQPFSQEERLRLSELPEIWGGLECTINRVEGCYRDQFEYTGHYRRPGDLEKIADLGIQKIRYPILWERHVRFRNSNIDWRWADEQIRKILDLGMDPIIGFVHHGSGPSYTDLLDPAFPGELAAYARQVAERYPDVRYFTPVNEPLTTARFSGLYGWWYPHKKDPSSFVRMLIHQCMAIVRCMQAVREVNPNAKLIQTEDLAKTYSTEHLQYQADFENERRWFSMDLLCGKISKGTVLWNYFESLGVKEDELAFFQHNNFPPDLLGFNYYITSERYLDHDHAKYSPSVVGGNGIDSYADIEAVRVPMNKPHGLKQLLNEAWERYQIPMAITEVHMGCTREEQMRWLKHVWDTCCEIKKEGVDLVAITPWSLLGAFDWNSILTRNDMHYEPGAFDIMMGDLRPTALADMVRALSREGKYDHPLLKLKGWWNQEHRFVEGVEVPACQPSSVDQGRPLLIIGNNMPHTWAFTQVCEIRGIPFKLLSGGEINVQNRKTIAQALKEYDPWAIVICAGLLEMDQAEMTADENIRLNTKDPLRTACDEKGVSFMRFSSGIVSPAYLPNLVHASLDLLIDDAEGIWQLADEDQVSWSDFALELGQPAGPGGFRLVRKKQDAVIV